MLRKTFFFSLPDVWLKDKEEHFVLSFSSKGLNIIKFYSESKQISLIGEYVFDGLNEKNFSEKEPFHKFLSGFMTQIYAKSHITCILQSENIVLVPKELYNSEKKKVLQDTIYQKPKLAECLLFEDTIKHNDEEYVLISNTPQWQYDLTQFITKEKTVRRQGELMLNTFCSKKKSDAVYLYVLDGFFYLTIISHNRLIFFNTFSFQTAKDFCYFVIASMQVNNVSNDTVVYVTGDIMIESEAIALLKKYIAQIVFLQTAHSIDSEEVFLHRFYTQLSI